MFDIECRKDCVYRENESCKLKIEPYNSIFPVKKIACIYYNQDLKNQKKHYDLPPTL